jgi:TPR repeat protein
LYTKDTQVGFRLVSLSALGRHSPAQGMLAAIYLDGKVVRQDLIGAYFWSTIAVRNPNARPDMAVFVQKIQASARSQISPEEFEKAQSYINR